VPLADSVLIDAGANDPTGPTGPTDQRGLPRFVDLPRANANSSPVDIGAVAVGNDLL
jgi:hypothetical protein